MTYGIGTKETRKCYDGKMHECTILDCSIILRGKTYEIKSTIKADRFTWWNDEKMWVKQVDNEKDINDLVEKYKALGVRVQVEPNFRITDTEVNPIR